jgi:hypothetical protein
MLADDSSYPLDSDTQAPGQQPAFPAPGLVLQPPPHRRAFLIGFVAMLAVCLLGFLAMLATGAVARLAQSASKHVASVLHPDVINAQAAQARLRQAGGADLTFPFTQPRIRICKEYGELDLYNGDRFVKRYKAALAGPKDRPGAAQLPEGTFAIHTHDLPRKIDNLTLGLNFPRTADADAALKAGTITQAQRDAIAAAEKSHQAPPADMPLGGAIAIHASGAAAGGIGLPNDQAAELFVATTPGTPVVIEK